MKYICLLSVLTWSLVSCQPVSSEKRKADFAPLDSMIRSWISRNYYPGASMAVADKDTVLFEKYYGNYTPETEVYVASAGKWVAAAVVAAVVDHTELAWGDSIARWLPEFRGNNKAGITLRQLLSHTSGIPDYHPLPKVDVYNRLDSAVADILPLDTVFMPGTRFQYGGLAMQVAGRMAEVAGGTDFEQLFHKYIAGPLGMGHTHFIPVDHAEGHSPMLGGGLRTTLHDYMRFLNMIFHDGMFGQQRILSAEAIREMQADQTGGAYIPAGEYVERALGSSHKGIYGLGEWRELIDEQGNAYQISSPGWAGAYPWINKKDGIYGFFLTHVAGNSAARDNFSPFYDAPQISRTVTEILSLSVGGASVQLREADFICPPQQARPSTYWEWMNGNINREGLTKDLEYMKHANYGAAMMFEAGVGIPRGDVDYNSEAWKQAVTHAVKEAERLGMKLSMHNAPGYSGTGGPWITPEYSMKQLVWTDAFAMTDRRGAIHIKLPQPYTKMGFYRDAYVLAYPSLPREERAFASAVKRMEIDGKEIDKTTLLDHDIDTQHRMEGGQTLLIELDAPFEAQAATAFRGKREQPLDPHDGPRDYAPTLTLEASADGVHFTSIGTFRSPALRTMDTPSTLSFAPVKARWFRLTTNRGTNLSEIDLHASARLEGYAAKINALSAPVGLEENTQKMADGNIIQPGQVIDVTDRMDSQGNLSWEAPHAGRWTIVRIGYTTTGEVVAAAPDSGIGLDCDKLSRDGVDRHFALFLSPLLERLHPWCGRVLESLAIDSWEAGKQNWTESLPDSFKAKRGYDIMPRLLAVTGRIVGSVGETERFLWDFRRTHTDMFLENYVERFKEHAARYGLTYAGEAYGDGNFESLEMAARQDVPMCEFWTHYIYGNISTTMLTASAAHVWGKPVVACEAYTGTPFNSKFTEHPYGMKALADYILSAGVNRLVYHATTHQPYTGNQPGNLMTMGPFGTHLDRTSTWAEQFAAFNLYVSRCCYMLQQGRYSADVLYLKDEAISSGVANYNTAAPATPYGYRWDIASTEALHKRITVKDGRITLPDGMNYKLMVVPPMERTSPETLRRILELVRQGMSVMLAGGKPVGYLGLDSQKDQKVRMLADSLWHEGQLGKGHVYLNSELKDILKKMCLHPDFSFRASRKDAQIHFIHRTAGDDEVYFVANHRRRPEQLTVTCRVAGKVPVLWDAETGETNITVPYKEEDGMTRLNIDLAECGSVFIVFRPAGNGYTAPARSSDIEERTPLPTVLHTRQGDKAYRPEGTLRSTFSISLWAKPETFAAAGRGFLLCPGDVGEGKASAGISLGQNGLRIYERHAGRNALVMEHLHPVEGWTHIALTYREGVPTLYLNGKRAAIGHRSAYDCLPAVDIPMAEEQYTASFEGDQTETELFGYALSEAEVDSLFRTGLPAPRTIGQPWIDLSQAWQVEFPAWSKAPAAISLPRLQSLHKHEDFNVSHFSGTATYRKTFTLSTSQLHKLEGKRILLELGRVENMAEVSINGSAPILLWKAPFTTDITSLLHAGTNEVTIRVTNLYPNRLIGDEHLPDPYEYDRYGRLRRFPNWYLKGEPDNRERVLFSPWKHYRASDPLLESGLTGPVRLTTLPAQR